MTHDKTIDRNVLLVDDEPLFLKFASIPFKSGFCGFCTWNLHTFTDTSSALGFYELYADKIDVVLTDFHMPEMNGIEFISAVRSTKASRAGVVPAIIVSSDPPSDSRLPELTSTVSKPFTKDDIARALCSVSVVCETGACTACGGSDKPRPAAAAMRGRTEADDRVAVW